MITLTFIGLLLDVAFLFTIGLMSWIYFDSKRKNKKNKKKIEEFHEERKRELGIDA